MSFFLTCPLNSEQNALSSTSSTWDFTKKMWKKEKKTIKTCLAQEKSQVTVNLIRKVVFFSACTIYYYGTRKRNRKKMLTMTRSKKIWIKLKKKSLHALLLTHLIPLSPPQSNWTIHYYYIKIVTQSHFNTCIRGRVLRTLLYRGIQSICKTTPSNR